MIIDIGRSAAIVEVDSGIKHNETPLQSWGVPEVEVASISPKIVLRTELFY